MMNALRRRENLRELVHQWGGPTTLAKHLKYANGSFLSQMIGPNPSRDVTEKVARNIERRLGLEEGYLDRSREKPTKISAAESSAISEPPGTSSDRIASAVTLVQDICERANIKLEPRKFGCLVALACKSPLTGASWEQYVVSLLELVAA